MYYRIETNAGGIIGIYEGGTSREAWLSMLAGAGNEEEDSTVGPIDAWRITRIDGESHISSYCLDCGKLWDTIGIVPHKCIKCGSGNILSE